MHLQKDASYLPIVFLLLRLAIWPVFGYAQNPSIVAEFLAEGDLLYTGLNNQQAIQSYKKAIDRAPGSFDVLTRLANTVRDYGLDLQADDRSDEAEVQYEEALGYALELERLYPDSARTQYLLATIKRNLALVQGGRQKFRAGREIERHCLKGLSIDSTDAALHVLYGVFVREMATMSWVERTMAQALECDVPVGTKEQALNYIAHAVELDPALHIAHFEAGLTYLSIGRRTEAIYHLEQAETLPAQTTQDNRNRQLAKRILERLRIE